MEPSVKIQILEEDEVSAMVTELMVGNLSHIVDLSTAMSVPPDGVTDLSCSSTEDTYQPKRPKIQNSPDKIQPLDVLDLHRQEELLKPKIEYHPRQALLASNQVPPSQTPELWRQRVQGCHGTTIPISSHPMIKVPQFVSPRVQVHHGATMPIGTELLKPKNEYESTTHTDILRQESRRMPSPPMPTSTTGGRSEAKIAQSSSRNFWKLGDYEEQPADPSAWSFTDMDHVRVHPMFLHSNATSHKWSIGALAELLDNAMDERKHGATFVNIDILVNKKDGRQMLLVEDNGGGMNPNGLRQCMSFGFSVKRKSTDTVGQYGNGFKTSTMRLGADVIVFSRCAGKEGNGPSTQSVGLLSYTFLTKTRKEDIVVPIIDYKREGGCWDRLGRSSPVAWIDNLKTILQWSPYSSEDDLLQQFGLIKDQGTRVVIYNLWEDDQDDLELDFDTDTTDIQVRGANRDEKKISLAEQFPNSRHFLTYAYSLRSYASILYLKIPQGFKMILRGREIEHHNIVDDMMLKKEVIYRSVAEQNAYASITIGFVKDAKEHMDIQGFNVYHNNRLIKPFWRAWHAAGSGGRGVIGVLEANFIEPAHDKQGFERTMLLFRLETWLKELQKKYWRENSESIGYGTTTRHKKLTIDNRDLGGHTSIGGLGSDPGYRISTAGTDDAYRASKQNSMLSSQVLVNRYSRFKDKGESFIYELQFEKERNKMLGEQLEATKRNLEETYKKLQHSMYMIAEERRQKGKVVEIFGKKLKEANATVKMLLEKIYHNPKVTIKQEH